MQPQRALVVGRVGRLENLGPAARRHAINRGVEHALTGHIARGVWRLGSWYGKRVEGGGWREVGRGRCWEHVAGWGDVGTVRYTWMSRGGCGVRCGMMYDRFWSGATGVTGFRTYRR